MPLAAPRSRAPPGRGRPGAWSSTGARSRPGPRAPRARADLVHDVVVDQVAELLGLDPDEVDPDRPRLTDERAAS